MTWQHLDNQMARWAPRLTTEVRLPPESAAKIATTIAAEVRFLEQSVKDELRQASPVPLGDRLGELQAFQGWMELAGSITGNPYVTRAQVLCQNYICFVYLSEACFKVLAKRAPSNSVTKRCAQFLTDNPVRAFRNAIAHANWRYREDFHAIAFWSRKGVNPDEPLEQFEVEERDLEFWQALSRCVAYAAYSNL